MKNEKLCHYCCQPITQLATVCHHCGYHQSFLRQHFRIEQVLFLVTIAMMVISYRQMSITKEQLDEAKNERIAATDALQRAKQAEDTAVAASTRTKQAEDIAVAASTRAKQAEDTAVAASKSAKVAEKNITDLNNAFQKQILLIASIAWFQLETKSEFGTDRARKAGEGILNDINQVLPYAIPDPQERAKWIQQLKQRIPPSN